MMQGPKRPAFVIPTSEIGAVVYVEKKAVGIQFVDPNGQQVFISIPGRMIPALAKSLNDLAVSSPEILQWSPVGPK